MFPLVAMLSSFLSDSLDNVASWICSMGMGNGMVGGSEKDGNPKLSDSFFDSVEDRLSFGQRLLLAFGQGRGQGVCSVDPSPAVALRAVLEVPLFHEPAIASTILCNVVIIILRSICSYVSVPMAHLRQRPSRRHHFTGKKSKKPLIFTQELEKLISRPFPKLRNEL